MKYDVAVVGGGLAGCSAAIRLARRGIRVVLCEAADYPQHKVCGEFMSPGCRVQLRDLNIMEAIEARGATAIHESVISTPDETRWEALLPGAGIGISRYVVDDLLAAECRVQGVVLQTRTRVTDICGSLRDGFTLHTHGQDGRHVLEAATVIGAYGKRSRIDHQLERSFVDTRQPFIGLKQHMRQVPVPNRVELHTFEGGYCGLSEIEDGLTNVCLLVREEVFRAHSSDGTASFIAWMIQQNPLLADRLDNAEAQFERWLSCAQVPFVDKQVVDDDILMTGDAAGMITPLTGDGMEIALQSGELAAQHLLAYFESHSDPQTLTANYASAWQAAFGRRVQVGRLSQFFMLRPAWLRWGLQAFQVVPPLGDLFIRQTRHVDYLDAG